MRFESAKHAGVLAIFFSLLSAACQDQTPYPQVITRNQASYDFDCPTNQIQVAPLGNHRFLAEGCFKREVYLCSSGIFLPESSIECKQQLGSALQGLEPLGVDE